MIYRSISDIEADIASCREQYGLAPDINLAFKYLGETCIFELFSNFSLLDILSRELFVSGLYDKRRPIYSLEVLSEILSNLISNLELPSYIRNKPENKYNQSTWVKQFNHPIPESILRTLSSSRKMRFEIQERFTRTKIQILKLCIEALRTQDGNLLSRDIANVFLKAYSPKEIALLLEHYREGINCQQLENYPNGIYDLFILAEHIQAEIKTKRYHGIAIAIDDGSISRSKRNYYASLVNGDWSEKTEAAYREYKDKSLDFTHQVKTSATDIIGFIIPGQAPIIDAAVLEALSKNREIFDKMQYEHYLRTGEILPLSANDAGFPGVIIGSGNTINLIINNNYGSNSTQLPIEQAICSEVETVKTDVKSVLLSKAFEDFQQYKTIKRVSVETLKINANVLKQFTASLGEDKAINLISDSDVETFLLKYISNGQASTASRYYDTLSSFAKYCILKKLLTKSFMESVPKPKRKDTIPKHLSADEIQKMIDICDTNTFIGIRDRAIIYTLFDTGLRANELTALDLDDMNLSEKTLTVKNGKGDKPRIANYSATTSEELQKYLDARNVLNSQSTKVFIKPSGGELSRYNLADLLGLIGDKVGIKVSPHMLRHSCGVAMASSKASSVVIQRQLGHSTIRMAQHYSQMTDSEQKNAYAEASPVGSLKKNCLEKEEL